MIRVSVGFSSRDNVRCDGVGRNGSGCICGTEKNKVRRVNILSNPGLDLSGTAVLLQSFSGQTCIISHQRQFSYDLLAQIT